MANHKRSDRKTAEPVVFSASRGRSTASRRKDPNSSHFPTTVAVLMLKANLRRPVKLKRQLDLLEFFEARPSQDCVGFFAGKH